MPFAFDILVQSGSAFALFARYKDIVFSSLKNFFISKKFRNLVINLFIAFCPLVLAALIVPKNFTESMQQYSGFLLLFVGILLIFVDIFFYKPKTYSIFDITLRQAIFIGLMQIAAIIPGVSRSGITILAAIFSGMSRKASIEFSFILAIPSILSASVYCFLFQENIKIDYNFTVAWFGAFLLTFFLMKRVLFFIEKNGFCLIGFYRVLFGIVFIFFFKQWI